ncbi:MAG: asparagine synthetase B family protein [Acidobacteriota bacterium]
MSGIVGVVHGESRSVNVCLLHQMTDLMARRGPDARNTKVGRHWGFGHALLRTTDESRNEHQPCSVDGSVWIAADARVDDRDSLEAKLVGKEPTSLAQSTDAELILHAYHLWGEDLVDHLLGDFAFAIWDERRQRLFCARDQFGIKPFYYARLGDGLVFSNTLDCLRSHPEVLSELNELSIADFLLFGFNRHLDLTAFSNIRRLPPAYALSWSPGDPPEVRRYWTLPVLETIRYRRQQDYVDHFLELLGKAVADRLRTDRVGVLMSGGLDSTSVACMASEVLSSRPGAHDLRAFTFVYDRLIRDEERHFSGLVARALSIPIHHLSLDEDEPGELWEARSRALEPVDIGVASHTCGLLRDLSSGCRVGLTGQGGDPMLHLSPADFVTYFKKVGVARTTLDIVRYRQSHGHLPRAGIRTSLKLWLGKGTRDGQPCYPPWLDGSLEERWRLPDRWRNEASARPSNGAVRPQAQHDLTAPMWATMFENYDPGASGFPAEVRHPYFDLRLVEYLLALPPIPWCVEKELLRVAMRGRLPEAVRQRRKAPLAGFPVYESLQREGLPHLDVVTSTPDLGRFIDIDRFLEIARSPQKLRPFEYDLITRPYWLALWLHRLGPAGVN